MFRIGYLPLSSVDAIFIVKCHHDQSDTVFRIARILAVKKMLTYRWKCDCYSYLNFIYLNFIYPFLFVFVFYFLCNSMIKWDAVLNFSCCTLFWFRKPQKMLFIFFYRHFSSISFINALSRKIDLFKIDILEMDKWAENHWIYILLRLHFYYMAFYMSMQCHKEGIY